MISNFISSSEDETIQIGKDFSSQLISGDIVELIGDLGTGKTHFVKGVSLGIGVKKSAISPTFTIVNEYNGGRIPIYHIDCYRLLNSKELLEIGIEDYFFGEGVCVIEWGNKIEEFLPLPRYQCEFKYGEKVNERIIEITKLEKI